MIFAVFERSQALGVVLAHSILLSDRLLASGRVLDEADLAALARDGIAVVMGARLEAQDVGQNDAVAQLAKLVAGERLLGRADDRGQCVLHASAAGVLTVDRERVDRLNLVDEAITLATLPPYALVGRDDPVASLRILPFAVPKRLLTAWRRIAANEPVLRLAPLEAQRVALILSDQPGLAERAADPVRKRVVALGSRIELELRCRHEAVAVQRALAKALHAGCDLVLISGASATRDRADLLPAAILAAGGEIEHFGMPVHPGQEMLLARVGRIPVVVFAEGTRADRSNGLDWVLQRLLAKLPLARTDIMLMGVGGLLGVAPAARIAAVVGASENAAAAPREAARGATLAPVPTPATAARVAARRGASRAPESPLPQRPARVAALVLAAGQSARIGLRNKLLARVAGVPMVRRVVDAARGSRCDMVVMVTGHEADMVEDCAGREDLVPLRNPSYGEGMASSLSVGLRALPQDIDGVIVLYADMPHIADVHIDRLIGGFDPAKPAIVVPEHGGRRGNPVLWPRRFFDEMLALKGDAGTRELLMRHARETVSVSMNDDAIFCDVDTPADLAKTEDR